MNELGVELAEQNLHGNYCKRAALTIKCPIAIQWNPYSGHPWGNKIMAVIIIEVAFIEGLFCTQTVHLGPGFLAVIQRWPLFRGGR